ncbi:MAG: NADH-quinone oxidoreductase subunit L, partial [Candidatus Omnitrophica bacterium]|nr:NADH-quinone oxidoreductase subunit L [Candidatus Omnitrophota bacterium]
FVPLLFFWEGLLVTLYLFILLGGKPDSFRTALKAFVLVGLCDFCFIGGVALYWKMTGSFDFPVRPIPVSGIGLASFILMVIGATGKAGALPFHTWIPDAAVDAPVGFMAFLPGALEKLLGIYLLTVICFDFFSIIPGSPGSMGLMSLGALTIVIAVSMALIQKDIKRLLSYHAISQVGYMIVGIGTGMPAGIAGGLFHMLNNAIYKSALFLGAGSVEHKTKTSDLKFLGGLYNQMPVTGLCFIICAAAISGVWPLNGYVSKEMVIHSALETGYKIFAVACWIGAILTFASFLKASHSMFFGETREQFKDVKENGPVILFPMIVLAALCIFFGVYNRVPLSMISGSVSLTSHHEFSAHALDILNPISGITVLCLIIAFLLHTYGWYKAGKKAHLASEVVHNLPVIKKLYELAERRIFDIYHQGMRLVNSLSIALYYGFDRSSDWLYETLIVQSGKKAINSLRFVHRGYVSEYAGWIFVGVFLVALFILIF